MKVLETLQRWLALPRVRLEKPDTRLIWMPSRQAGMRINHDTALTMSAVYGCVRVIAETVAQLPWHVYTTDTTGERLRTPASPVERVLAHAPNGEMGSFTWRETMMGWALTWGNAYAEIGRDGSGRVSELWPISPDRVQVERDDDNNLVYLVNGSGGQTQIQAADMFHLHGLGFDGRTGYSVISLAARSIGIGMAADEFGASFFGNNTVIGGILKHPSRLGEDAYQRLKDSWAERHQGPQNAHRPVILEEGMDWQSLGVPNQDAQFLETRKFQVEEICRWYRVPPHKVASLERATFSNIEHQSIEFVQDAIVPWCLRLEQEADRKLFGRERVPGRTYTKLNTNALLRGDTQSRAQFYRELWNLGVLSINEIRELEDMRGIGSDGDKRFVQLNMTTVERAGEEPEAPPAPPTGDEEDEDMTDALNARIAQLDHGSMRAALGIADRFGDDRTTAAAVLTRALDKRRTEYVAGIAEACPQAQSRGDVVQSWLDRHLGEVRRAAFARIDGDGWQEIDPDGATLLEALAHDHAA